jgi:integrase
MTTTDHPILDGIAATLAATGLTIDELAAHIAANGGDTTTSGPSYPTLSEHLADVRAALSPGSLRTWNTHFGRLEHGTHSFCSCVCDACEDLEAGCGCDCKDCADKLAIPACGDRELRPGSFVKSELNRYATVAKRMAIKRAVVANQRRAKKGLHPLPAHGKGGAENAITAWRHLFGVLVDDELWDKNPALALDKPKRDDTKRRGMRDDELPEYFRAIVSGGNDPELDFLLSWFHLETGAREGGAIDLQMAYLQRARQMIELHEKGEKVGDQPASVELIDALTAHAISRGGSRCDPDHDDYDPTSPVFYYRHPAKAGRKGTRNEGRPGGGPAPLTARRYDSIHERVQLALPWANEIQLTTHALRKTGASIIEQIAGTETARLFLRHGRRTVTQTYTQSWEERLAAAFVVFTGRTHPLAPGGGQS